MSEQEKTSPAEPVQTEQSTQSAQPSKPVKSPKPLSKRAQKQLDKKREGWAKRQQDKRDRDKAASDETHALITTELSDKEIRNVFSGEGIKNVNVINQCVANGIERARELNITLALPYWQEGFGTQLSIDEIGGRSEVLSVRELYALWHFTASGLRILGIDVDFQDWLQLRDRARKDLYWLACTVLKIPLVEEVHRPITEDFYPHLNADGMFTLNYTLTDMHAAIAQQGGDTREYLELDPRAFMKTAIATSFALQFALNFPECRIYDVSGTDDLALGFLRIMKGYLGHESGAQMSTMSLLFPEYTLRSLDATSEQPVLLPCRRYYQKDFSLETFGCTSAASGRHCDLYIGDDCVQEPGTETTREKLKNRLDTLSLNIPDAHSIRLGLGTRYHREDYYSHKIALMAEDPTAMKFLCRGVMTPKPGFEDIPVQDQKLEQVNLLWPTQAGTPEKTFAAYQRQMRVNLNDFLHQKMNSPVSEEESQKLHFDRIWFTRNTVQEAPIAGDVYGTADLGFSKTKYRDPSALTLWRVGEDKLLYCLTQEIGRWTTQEKAAAFVRMARQYPEHFKSWIIEKPSNWADIQRATDLEASQYGFKLGVFWAPVDITPDRKFHALKSMEAPLASDKIKFVQGSYLEPLITEVENLDNTDPKRKSKPGGSDDLAESLEIGIRFLLPDPIDETAIARQKLEEQQEEKERRARQYNRIFGSVSVVPTSTALEDYPQSDPNANPIYRALKPLNQGRPEGEKKVFGFGYMNQKPTGR